jgi:hypothetical protein
MALSLQLTVQWVVVMSPAGSLYALPWLVGVDRSPCFVRALVLSAAAVVVALALLRCSGTPVVRAGDTGLSFVVVDRSVIQSTRRRLLAYLY